MEDLSTFITKRNKDIDSIADTDIKLNMSRFKWLVFSDNIIFFALYEDETDAINLWSNLLYGISEFYMQYEWDDIFLRGSLTKGNLHYDEKLHFVYGSALVKANDLE